MLRFAIIANAEMIGFAQCLAKAQWKPRGERDKILSKMSKDYAEQLVLAGLSANGTLVEVLASKCGNWTRINTKPNGGTCVIATAPSWEDSTKKVDRPAA